MTRMFDFITDTKNPLGGNCYECIYCYIHGNRGMKNRFPVMRNKYSGEFRLYEKVFDEKIKGKFCFFCDCIDYLHPDNPDNNIYRIYEWIELNPEIVFLSLTKNPRRYKDFIDIIPINMIIGFTCESDINYPEYSKAPLQFERIKNMIDISSKNKLSEHKTFLSIEPILRFNIGLFLDYILQIKHIYGIAIGYDNYNYKLDEPSLIDTYELYSELIHCRYRLFLKTFRNAWWEK